ncbi:MAG TPA: glycoside hydrolase family 2 TIM barrel-domain containing protein, partial [Pseudonocardiaceae bacterium]|nr:glycoside hydrolase family 2 TIM barrel-domain containing protein [Pseudonocardiaceae bacterium]
MTGMSARNGPTRRRFLIGLGVGVIGATSLGAVLLDGDSPAVSTTLGAEWLFGRYTQGAADPDFDDTGMAPVTLPHCVTDLSWQGWQPADWERLWVYRQHFDAPADLRRGRAFLTFDGVLSTATVYLNGRKVGGGGGGYLPLTCELTGALGVSDNVLAVRVDGRWNQDVPPDLPRFPKASAIDFYQPAGIYRPMTVRTTPKAYLSDVFTRPVDVLGPGRSITVRCTVDAAAQVAGQVRLTATLSQGGPELTAASVELAGLQRGTTTATLTLTGLAQVKLWDVDDPAMCDVRVTLDVGGQQTHEYAVRTGLRDASFTQGGFFLNGRRLKLFGLNRHQWYPFAGGAMPDRVQRRDAEILKRDLNCNMVRCSHYPQAGAFLDACDELGLLVWEEVPGWDYVGDQVWRDRVVDDVRTMVTRDRNHPSIIVWGTRVNETLGQVDLYDHTDELARQLDPSRPCSGAVSGERGYLSALYPMTNGSAVFAFNDYSKLPAPDAPAPLRPPRSGVPYLVSEAIGSLVGAPSYRRTDPVAAQQDQATLHAWVHERAASDDRYCGLLAWCGFDYPSGWFHSVNGVKYVGVVDFFRIPKLGAAFYRAQVDPAKRVVIEPAFYWDFGPGSPQTGPGPAAVIWSNCDRLKLYLDGRPAASVRPDHIGFPHLAYPPFIANLRVRADERPELRIDGYRDGELALRRLFSPDPTQDTLACAADDDILAADGQDTTRIEIRALDRYGAARPYVQGSLDLALDGPGVL